MSRVVLAALISLVLGAAGPARALDSSLGTLSVTRVVGGLSEPWALGFLPEGGLLITERAGRLSHVSADGTATRLGGVPQVADVGQGGLLDLLIPRDFATTRTLFLTYSARQGCGQGTAVARATFAEGARSLTGVQTIFEMRPGTRGGRHFGSRLVEGRDGFLYVTVGDRGDGPNAQNLATEAGSVLRIGKDGSLPSDNPFATQAGAAPAIWSYGHRNPQGATLDDRGNLLVIEHGARGGDEVNVVRRGVNYGWPEISYGVNYNGSRIGQGTAAPGLAQPAHYWDPSIAPSGATVYDGRLFADWRGDLFVGSLKFGLISRLERDGDGWREVERLQGPETGRVRDIRTGPDGALWFLSVTNGALYRISR